ncbi:MAG: putative site-specific DNA-methyltransferase [Candidatus Saccharibacteria bacterium]|nr:putative site-specific DNA-methyltransferase [Candidatus Saccharibacteria bacterium]
MGTRTDTKTVADFFAGIGLVTLGLNNAGWETTYALDYDELKELQYTTNFGPDHFHTKDIAEEKGENVPNVTLAHASFPCTDLSLAGRRKGIYQGESQAFWQFARILKEMKKKHGEASPNYVLLENVEGLLTSNSGMDLREVLDELNALGYRVDLLRVNAAHFVAQSRVRIFIIGVHNSLVKSFDSSDLMQEYNLRSTDARPAKILEYINKHSDIDWYFHRLPNLPVRTEVVADIIDLNEEWWPEERTNFLYSQLHERQCDILEIQKNSSSYRYYAGFRRMRVRDGKRQSTVELRNDGIAGCLRTPKGGSARQIVVRAGKGRIDARLFNGVEAGRLMGAKNFIIHPSLSLNQALFGFGDAVCVPVLQWLGENYFNTLLEQASKVPVEGLVETGLNAVNQVPVLDFQD